MSEYGIDIETLDVELAWKAEKLETAGISRAEAIEQVIGNAEVAAVRKDQRGASGRTWRSLTATIV